nr:retrovirus-related Pol polyprotein from transposon TNT 1-94 [Tanacetum cinerariifolium]
MESMNTMINIKKLDGNIVQKHGGSKQVGFKQLGPGVETRVHIVHNEKRVWCEVELQGAQGDREVEVFQEREYQTGWKIKTGNVLDFRNQRLCWKAGLKDDNGKSVQIPLGGLFKLSLKDCPIRDCDVERMSKVPYANAVGSLIYLMVCTRPDIAYADVTGFVDSDYAKDPDKGRSITGYAFLVQGCVVSWKVMLQHVVALSTTEAEYMALIEAVKEAIWLRGLLEELGVELNRVTINCDNQDAIHLSRNHVFHERTKHINVRYHFIREVLEAKTVEVLKVGTEHNVADALTKVVPRHKLQHCLELLSVGIG